MKILLFISTLIFTTQLSAQISEDLLLNSLKKQFDLTKYDNPSEKIIFNNDTAVFAGYLGNPSDARTKNVVYKTTDGGKNWKVITFDGNAWIYTTHHSKNGQIWMGGSDNVVHFSNDFGETWERKIEPFKPVNRVLSIFMVDSLYGIAGGLSNGLAITRDNWKTSEQLETPLDQEKFQIVERSARNKVGKIAIVDSLIIINQNDYIFYSKISDIDWKKFTIPVSDFYIYEDTKEIHLASRNEKYFVVGSDLILKRSYQQNETFFTTIREEKKQLDLNDFLASPISSIDIISTRFEFDKQVHMSAVYKEIVQEATVYLKDNRFIFKSKDYENIELKLKREDLVSLFSDSLQVQLSDLSNQLIFSESDFENYKTVLEKEAAERKERENWGGNFTSKISLDNPLFVDFQAETDNLNQVRLETVFNLNYLPSRFSPKNNSIQIIFKNENGEELTISNFYSQICSLPWKITQNGSIQTYNPRITEFLKSILPTDFSNYDMLLGGQLIYELLEERIIDELEFEDGF